MLPLSLLRTAQNHPMLVELKNGETYQSVEGEEVVVMVVGEEAEMASTATLGARCRQSIGGA